MKKEEKEKENKFVQLVLSLHGSSLIALGKVTNPLSGKVERDLVAARNSIDMLEMLRGKTEGNLSDEEEKLIASCISTLQMSYIEEFQSEKTDGGGKPSS